MRRGLIAIQQWKLSWSLLRSTKGLFDPWDHFVCRDLISSIAQCCAPTEQGTSTENAGCACGGLSRFGCKARSPNEYGSGRKMNPGQVSQSRCANVSINCLERPTYTSRGIARLLLLRLWLRVIWGNQQSGSTYPILVLPRKGGYQE
jgi:hypothetical protein